MKIFFTLFRPLRDKDQCDLTQRVIRSFFSSYILRNKIVIIKKSAVYILVNRSWTGAGLCSLGSRVASRRAGCFFLFLFLFFFFGEAAAACNQHRGGQRSNVHICMRVKEEKTVLKRKKNEKTSEPFNRPRAPRGRKKKSSWLCRYRSSDYN